ncbi:MAG: hypothetical protein ACM3YE_05895 [Bacteroidota bacterium]
MLFEKKFFWIITLVILVGFSCGVYAGTSHEVAIGIAEIGRYHLENKAVITNSEDLIQTIDVVVLSNSDRKWRFVAVPFGECAGVEWSKDNRVWHSLDVGTGETMLFTGERSNWNCYRFYLKVNKHFAKGINLGYQLLFNE